MKAEWNPCHLALIMNVNDPFIVKRPGVSARLPAYRDLLDQRRIKIIAKVDFLQHRSDNHKAVLDWQYQKKRQSRISQVLVLNRATNGDIVPSSPQSSGRQSASRSILFVKKKKEQSRRWRMISQMSSRQASASSIRKSDVKQSANSVSDGNFRFLLRSRLRGM